MSLMNASIYDTCRRRALRRGVGTTWSWRYPVSLISGLLHSDDLRRFSRATQLCDVIQHIKRPRELTGRSLDEDD